MFLFRWMMSLDLVGNYSTEAKAFTVFMYFCLPFWNRYCSPEYAFPTQQEVITFAANTAFELVTLNPRTLVVCGAYAVGKERVFLGK